MFSSRMAKPKALITHCETFKSAVDKLSKVFDIIICPELPYPTREEIMNKIGGVDAVFWSTKFKIDAEMLDKAGPNLKIISTCSAGYDHLDINEIKKRGIKVSNTPDVLSNTVANMAIGLMIATSRRFQEGRQKIVENKWEIIRPQWMLGKEIENSVIGIIGLGNIGSKIANRLKVFDVAKIIYTGRGRKDLGDELGAEFVLLPELLKISDFIIVSCLLNNETRGMLDGCAFKKMKNSAIIINVSRGEIIDQDSLVQALTHKEIWAAGLDVMYPEPLPADHPLLSFPNCIIVPHLGSATVECREKMALLTADNMICGIEGKPLLTPI